jgi:voltage-dependent potassium channel beta subunit
MEYRKLGKAGIRVSVIGLGGWINFEQKIPADEARRIVAMAYENGVNFYDVADAYGNGRAEEWMGGMLADYPRHTLVISSKVFFEMSDDPNDRGLSRKHIMESIDGTLRRLGTDYLDVYFCHRADPGTPIYETARAMDDLIHRGKILYWGTSMWEPERIEETVDLCEANGLIPPVVEQPEYSMLARQRVEEEVLPVTRPHGIGLTVYSPLARGMLTGKYDGGIPDGSRFDTEPWAKSGLLTDENVEKVQELKMVAGEMDVTRAQLALAWVLRQEGVSSVITGATKVGQIRENLGAADLTLAPDVVAAIDRILEWE